MSHLQLLKIGNRWNVVHHNYRTFDYMAASPQNIFNIGDEIGKQLSHPHFLKNPTALKGPGPRFELKHDVVHTIGR